MSGDKIKNPFSGQISFGKKSKRLFRSSGAVISTRFEPSSNDACKLSFALKNSTAAFIYSKSSLKRAGNLWILSLEDSPFGISTFPNRISKGLMSATSALLNSSGFIPFSIASAVTPSSSERSHTLLKAEGSLIFFAACSSFSINTSNMRMSPRIFSLLLSVIRYTISGVFSCP